MSPWASPSDPGQVTSLLCFDVLICKGGDSTSLMELWDGVNESLSGSVGLALVSPPPV